MPWAEAISESLLGGARRALQHILQLHLSSPLARPAFFFESRARGNFTGDALREKSIAKKDGKGSAGCGAQRSCHIPLS
jgi:hypothetical protein